MQPMDFDRNLQSDVKGFDSHQGKIFAEFKIWQMSEAQARASHRNKPTRTRYVDLDRFCRKRRYLIPTTELQTHIDATTAL